MDKCKYLQFEEIVVDGTQWVKETLQMVKSQFVGSVSPSSFTARRDLTKEMLAQRLNSVLRIVNRQNRYIIHLEKKSQQLKSEVNVDQGSVIDLQKELIAAKDQHLTDLKTTVVTSVKDTFKTELRSYSDTVQKSSNSGTTTLFDQKTLKSTVKNVVAEEDRSQDFMIFGLAQKTEKEINEKAGHVLLELGKKPKIEASRIGFKSSKAKKQLVCPVKVSVTSSIVVQQILNNSEQCRQIGLQSNAHNIKNWSTNSNGGRRRNGVNDITLKGVSYALLTRL